MSATYTVTIPLPAPAIMVAVAPPIFSGHASLSLSFSASKVVNRTALFVPCLHNTGIRPLHKESNPSCRVVCATSCGTGSHDNGSREWYRNRSRESKGGMLLKLQLDSPKRALQTPVPILWMNIARVHDTYPSAPAFWRGTLKLEEATKHIHRGSSLLFQPTTTSFDLDRDEN